MRKALNGLYMDSLFRNSFYLILATVVMAGFGFIFWLIAARLFLVADIGIATTLISVMNMIALLSLFGFDVALVRFLPGTSLDNQNRNINTGIIIVSLAAIILSTVFLLAVHTISPQLAFIRADMSVSIAFIFFCVVTALNTLTDSVFVADRKAKYTFFINTAFSLLRIILPFFIVSLGAWGIFTSVAISQTVGFALSIGVMWWKFGYRPACIVDRKILARVGSYSMSNYLGGIFNLLPATLLPIIILNHLGPEQAAFFYVTIMFGNLLYAIPWATTRALFAEGVHDGEALVSNIIKSAKVIALFMIPAVIVLVFFGGAVLHLFGSVYSLEGVAFLRLVSVTGIAVGVYAIFTSFFRVTKHPLWIVLINGVYAVIVLGLTYMLLPYGLSGVGIAWLAGYSVACLVAWAILSLTPKQHFVARVQS